MPRGGRSVGDSAPAMIDATAARSYPCPNCGGELCWTPGQMSFVCMSCGTTLRPESTQTTQPKFVEQDLASVPPEALVAKERTAMRCDGCHAVSYFERASAGLRCPFCGAASLSPYAGFADFFRPESIVPFLTSESAARDAATQWVRKAWFSPFGLGRLVRTSSIKGAYVPFWMFDTHVLANWDRAQVVRGIIETDLDALMVSADRDVDPHLIVADRTVPARGVSRV